MDTNATRIKHQYTQSHQVTAAEVFPLLCPVREADWLEDWKYRMVYSESGLVEKGCVFATGPEHGTETLWYVSHHDPEQKQLEFVKHHPGVEMVFISIQVRDRTDSSGSCSHISYEYTALNKERAQEMNRSMAEQFSQMMLYWEKAINHYLHQGEVLRSAE